MDFRMYFKNRPATLPLLNLNNNESIDKTNSDIFKCKLLLQFVNALRIVKVLIVE